MYSIAIATLYAASASFSTHFIFLNNLELWMIKQQCSDTNISCREKKECRYVPLLAASKFIFQLLLGFAALLISRQFDMGSDHIHTGLLYGGIVTVIMAVFDNLSTVTSGYGFVISFMALVAMGVILQ